MIKIKTMILAENEKRDICREGCRKIAVKIVGIFGNDTMKVVEVNV